MLSYDYKTKKAYIMNLLLSGVSPQIIDSVALVFVIVFAIRGLVKGFTKLFFSVFGTILALLFAVLLASSVALFLESEYSLVTSISNEIEGALTSIFGEQLMNTTLQEAQANNFKNLELGSILASIVLSVANDGSVSPDTTLNKIVCPTFAYYIALILAVIVLFIIFKILFHLTSAFVKKLHSIKLIAGVDRLCGFLLGTISGFIYLELAFLIISIVPIPFVQDINLAISQASFASFVHDLGLFRVVLDAISSTNILEFVKKAIIKQ
jgi:uncharacterized membrane protein required for colicin V production